MEVRWPWAEKVATGKAMDTFMCYNPSGNWEDGKPLLDLWLSNTSRASRGQGDEGAHSGFELQISKFPVVGRCFSSISDGQSENTWKM